MKNHLSAAIKWPGQHWRGIISAIIIASLAVLTLSLQLSSLVPGQNQYETATLKNIEHFPRPWNRSVNEPYTLPAYIIGKAIHNPLQGARITSVILGLLATVCLFYLLKLWFNARIATVGSLLFITSSWLLHTAHQAAPFILLVLAPLLIILPLAWYLRTKKHKSLAFFLFAASLGVAAYVPYMPWILAATLLVLILKEKEQLSFLKSWQITVAALIYFILLIPLFLSLLSHPGQLRELLGIPAHLPTITQYFSQFFHAISMIMFHSQPLPELHLGHMPMLDIFSSAMFLLGIYFYFSRLPKRRSVILFASLIILLLVIPLSSAYQTVAAILLPFVYICIIAGIVEILNQWFSYFPRNPLARNVGVALIVMVIGFTSFYHLQSYFIAWPKSHQTKAAYMVKLE